MASSPRFSTDSGIRSVAPGRRVGRPCGAVVAGRPVVANATHLRNLYLAGLWDPAPMVNDLRAHRYAMVILDAELYPEPVLAAIGQFYFVERSFQMNGASYHVFLPGTQ